MKTELIKQYTENLLNIYTKELLKNCDYDYILVLNNQEESQVINDILYTNYQDFYKHDYLKYSIPPIRKPRKLLTYNDGFNILNKVDYGTLAISSKVPYCTSLNHFVVDGHIYFHCGHTGHKLEGLNQLVCYNVVDDLGIHKEVFTHNHQSVHIYGFLKEVKENKKALLEAFLLRFTPGFTKNLNNQMIQNTMLLEIDIIHMNVKKHFH